MKKQIKNTAAPAPAKYNDRKTIKMAEDNFNLLNALKEELNTDYNGALGYLLGLHFGKQDGQTVQRLKEIVKGMIEAANDTEPSKRIIPNTNNIDLKYFELYGHKTNLKHRKNALLSFENEIKALKYR